jgi:NAD-dependent dihydropyrimidine dehydrogenase PreA subunit
VRVVVTTTPTEDAHYYYYYYARVTSRVSFTSVLREKKRGARKKHQPIVKTSSNGCWVCTVCVVRCDEEATFFESLAHFLLKVKNPKLMFDVL